MKKSLFAFLILISLSIVGVYVLIPNQITISRVEAVESSDRIIADFIGQSRKRNQWWPKDSTAKFSAPDTNTLEYKGYQYQFISGSLGSADILISTAGLKTKSLITWLSDTKSTYKISWRTSIEASNNPIERIRQYQAARKIKANMDQILGNFLSYIVNPKNIYGIGIERKTVKDTVLATSGMISASYPETEKVYKLINEVKAYAANKGSEPVNVPMLNISKNPQGSYQTTVAIPINKTIQADERIKINRMVRGNILVTEIKGGRGNIANGFSQLQVYMNDFRLASPAMPFESLVTDRTREPDTSKWVTRLYYPIY